MFHFFRRVQLAVFRLLVLRFYSSTSGSSPSVLNCYHHASILLNGWTTEEEGVVLKMRSFWRLETGECSGKPVCLCCPVVGRLLFALITTARLVLSDVREKGWKRPPTRNGVPYCRTDRLWMADKSCPERGAGPDISPERPRFWR